MRDRLLRARAAIVCGAVLLPAWALPLAEHAVGPAWVVAGGDADRGARLIRTFGCAACHAVPGIDGATGNVGPPLTRIAERSFIAGMLPNSPANMVRWIRDPQGVVPGNAMPDMRIGEADARDIAAYLYTLH